MDKTRSTGAFVRVKTEEMSLRSLRSRIVKAEPKEFDEVLIKNEPQDILPDGESEEEDFDGETR